MTTIFTARRRAEEFAAAVDSDAAIVGIHQAEVARLLGVVTVLRDRPEPMPHPEFISDLRARLMLEADSVLTPENAGLALPVRTRGARERRLVAAASAVVLIGGTAGMAAAAQSALPGEALYPIKRGIERAEAGLSMNDAGRGRDLLAQANARLSEVHGLVARDSVQSDPQVPATLNHFSTQATEGANLLLESFRETQDASSVVRVRTFAADGIANLERLAVSVPAEAQDELAAAALTLQDLDAQASGLCSTCAASLPAVEIPGLILARSEVDRAMGSISAAELDNSHPVVVPKGTVQKKRDHRSTSASGSQDGSDGARSPGAGPTAGPSVPGPGPKGVNPVLPDLDEEVSGGTKKLSQAPGKAVEDVSDGLGDVVETLLPDSGVDEDLDNLLP